MQVKLSSEVTTSEEIALNEVCLMCTCIVKGGGVLRKKGEGEVEERIQRAKQQVACAARYRIHALHSTPAINSDCMVHLHTIDLV